LTRKVVRKGWWETFANCPGLKSPGKIGEGEEEERGAGRRGGGGWRWAGEPDERSSRRTVMSSELSLSSPVVEKTKLNLNIASALSFMFYKMAKTNRCVRLLKPFVCAMIKETDLLYVSAYVVKCKVVSDIFLNSCKSQVLVIETAVKLNYFKSKKCPTIISLTLSLYNLKCLIVFSISYYKFLPFDFILSASNSFSFSSSSSSI
jgi:hypothetical protein